MLSYERKLWEWIEKNINYFYAVIITIVSLMIRYGLRDFESGDMGSFLLPWYHQMEANGGFRALENQVGDYNILYQTIIAFFTYLPIQPIYQYKILSVIFDYLLAVVVGYCVYDKSKENRQIWGLTAYGAVCLSPLIFLNSACWGQCDSIYTFFCISSLVLFTKEKYGWSFCLYGIAFCFKFQSIFLLPFYLFVYVAKKRYSILYFLWIPFTMIVAGVPGIMAGRGIKDTFLIYLSQTETYPAMFLNYPSFWRCVLVENRQDIAELLRMPAVLFTVSLLIVMMFLWLKRKVEINGNSLLYMAFLVVFTCVLFLPSMHDRYGFLYEVLSIILVFAYPKTWILSLALHILSMRSYGLFLFDSGITNYYLLSVINFIVYLMYIVCFEMIFFPKGKKENI